MGASESTLSSPQSQ
ncbi:hypothetical protein CISIN_1g0280752mg, partial [Citrus sinensis]